MKPRNIAPDIGRLFDSFRRDRGGNFAIMTALTLPVLVGVAGLGTEVGLWYNQRQKMQSAADSAAVSAAYAAVAGTNYTVQANAVTMSYGYANGVKDVTVTVNKPPLSGTHKTAQAVEVIVQQPQPRLFSALFGKGSVNISGRAVANYIADGKGCVLALNKTKSGAALVQGNTVVNLIGCSLYDNSAEPSCAMKASGSAKLKAKSVNVVGGICDQTAVTTTDGTYTGSNAAPDPYASVPSPTPTGTVFSSASPINNTRTLSPGIYTKGLKLGAQANVTLQPGVYYIEAGGGNGGLDVAGGATLTGTGVTLVFTTGDGTNYATATINGGSNINLTAPTDGPYAGIVFFADRNMPEGTAFKFLGGANQNITGAIYLPKADVTFAGGINNPDSCLQLIGNTVTMTGDSYFAVDCKGKGTKPLSATQVTLVE
jgi:hypothetical protein